MQLVMCCSCGTFVRAVARDDATATPITDECPDCGNTEFKNNDTDRRIVVD